MSDKSTISPSKTKYIEALLSIYQKEIEVIYAIGKVWDQLKEEAKDQCADDFDEAIIARETLLEELADLRDAGIIPEYYEYCLHVVDQALLEQNLLVKHIYGLDVGAFLNLKKPKGLLKAKK